MVVVWCFDHGSVMSLGLLHSNGMPSHRRRSVRLTACSDRPALDTPSSFPCSLPLPGSFPLPCSSGLHFPPNRETSTCNLAAAGRPPVRRAPPATGHAPTHPSTHALINSETRQICPTASALHRLVITSVSAVSSLFLDQVARSGTDLERKKLDPGRP